MRRWGAHPRSRGADTRTVPPTRPRPGSSPLARGGHTGCEGDRARGGLIPARAGRTAGSSRAGGAGGAHPRSRGADSGFFRSRSRARGSSPLARGGLGRHVLDLDRRGLIPARAGRTPADAAAAGCGSAHPRSRGADQQGRPGILGEGKAAHPRSRGADARRLESGESGTGSSPLARGGPGRVDQLRPREGLIPARAGRTKVAGADNEELTAHPRSRGADADQPPEVTADDGSSPLARGGPTRVRPRRRHGGLIPARAGRTPIRPSTHWWSRAHPRSRGADDPSIRIGRQRLGSSPLARGGHTGPTWTRARRRLIPARAGRTRRRRWASRRSRAHPRSRGADQGGDLARGTGGGSSPLARGGPPTASASRSTNGLIPARAGRTTPTAMSWSRARAHPRSRGADLEDGMTLNKVDGSSPLARGGLCPGRHPRRLRGLIPARAGRTSARHSARAHHAAHPRSRGADRRRWILLQDDDGSSPLARGGRGSGGHRELRRGLIPARAGRTSSRGSSAQRTSAHPRSRGADHRRWLPCGSTSGSSPLARGGPRLRARRAVQLRLIPARAGRTRRARRRARTIRAHPRSRGADRACRSAASCSRGSSPLARGGPSVIICSTR